MMFATNIGLSDRSTDCRPQSKQDIKILRHQLTFKAKFKYICNIILFQAVLGGF